jgi:riboflavin kinase / FMN adenylyltransferase
MRIFYDFDQLTPIPNPVITTGSFDGVHVGHKAIINRINKIAADIGGESVLITFHPHPRKVLFPETAGKDLFLINSQREKIELLRKAGLQNLIIVTFTPAFSRISSIDFIRSILVGKLHASKIVIGFNHQFGYNREGNFDFLRELGEYYKFGVEEIPEQDLHNETVSSTLIRRSLQEGRIQRANAYLDHHYMIMGRLSRGSLHSGMKTMTYFIQPEEECKLIPPDGVYAVRMEVGAASLKGILNIKNSRYGDDRNPAELLIEIFPFGNTAELDGREATAYFSKRIREELNFESESQLLDQLSKDRQQVEEMIY